MEHDNEALAPITDQIEYLIPAGSKTSSLSGFTNFKVGGKFKKYFVKYSYSLSDM